MQVGRKYPLDVFYVVHFPIEMDDLAKPALDIFIAHHVDRGEEIVATRTGAPNERHALFEHIAREHRHRVLAHTHKHERALRLNMFDNEIDRGCRTLAASALECMVERKIGGRLIRQIALRGEGEHRELFRIVADDDNLAFGILARERACQRVSQRAIANNGNSVALRMGGDIEAMDAMHGHAHELGYSGNMRLDPGA